MLPVILDESCERLESLLAPLAETAVFRRSGGYLGDPELCAHELEAFCHDRFGGRRVLVVAGSFGALTALRFADCHPESVAGLVLVDPSHRQQADRALALLESAGAGDSPAAEAFRRHAADRAPAWWRAGCESAARLRPVGDLPVIVLAAGCPEVEGELPTDLHARLVADRHVQLREYAGLSTCGAFHVVERSGHDIATACPESVVQAVREATQAAVGRAAPR